MADGADENQEEQGDDITMSLSDHLDDLRTRLIRALLGLAVACGVTLYYGGEILAWILTPMVRVLDIAGLPHNLVATGVTTGFSVYFMVSLIAGLVIAFPWIIYQLWCFVRAGLYESERRVVVILAPFSGVMSILSVLFLYYVLLPITLSFMIIFTISLPPVELPKSGEGGIMEHIVGMVVKANSLSLPERAQRPTTLPGGAGAESSKLGSLPVLFDDPPAAKVGEAWIKQPEGEIRVQASEKEVLHFSGIRNNSPVQPLMSVDDYLSFVGTLAIGTLLAFQLPVVMTMVGWTGMINPGTVSRYRKYCFFACFVVAAIASPPDVLSMTALGIPIYGLFEFGLLCMWIAYRHATKDQPAEGADDANSDEGY
jgi:sec-independent protein translocase protein TatC